MSYLTNFYVIYTHSAFFIGKALCCEGHKKEEDMTVTLKKLKGLISNRWDKTYTHSREYTSTTLRAMHNYIRWISCGWGEVKRGKGIWKGFKKNVLFEPGLLGTEG